MINGIGSAGAFIFQSLLLFSGISPSQTEFWIGRDYVGSCCISGWHGYPCPALMDPKNASDGFRFQILRSWFNVEP